MLRLCSYDSRGKRADRGVIEINHPFLGVRKELTKGLKLFVRNEVECFSVHVTFAVKKARNRLRIILKETSKIKEF